MSFDLTNIQADDKTLRHICYSTQRRLGTIRWECRPYFDSIRLKNDDPKLGVIRQIRHDFELTRISCALLEF